MHSMPCVTPLASAEHAVEGACIIACSVSGPETVAHCSPFPKRMQTVHSTDDSEAVTQTIAAMKSAPSSTPIAMRKPPTSAVQADPIREDLDRLPLLR